MRHSLESILSPELYRRLTETADDKLKNKENSERERLKDKFSKLIRNDAHIINNNSVKNLSSRNLDTVENQVLSKGLNFAMNHSPKDILQFIAQVEPAIEDLKDTTIQEKSRIRQKVVSAVHSAQSCANISYEEKQAIRRLKSDPSIVIAKADKGNAVVVMDKDDYLRKVNEHLSDSNIYKTLPNNPQNQLKNSVNKVLQRLKSEKKLSKAEYDLLYCSTAQTPRYYALIKTHKINYPIRPIVSFIGSPTYQISKFLSKILTPFTNLASQKLKNSYILIN